MLNDPMGAGESERILSAYLEDRLSLVDAVTYFVNLSDEPGASGIGVDFQGVDEETRVRTEELFRRVAWCKLTGATPAAEPVWSFDDLLRALGRSGPDDPDTSV